MEEKDILPKTIEGLNTSVASLSATNKKQAEQNEKLQERIKELTAQVAWLNRQLFGRKSEKLRVYEVDKCIANTSLLSEILLQKYEYHVPFYRQLQQYRHLGMKGLTESTMDGWFKKTVELLKPLYEELKREVFSCDYVQADETTVPVINREKHKADKEYLWMVRSVMEKLVIFHYDGAHGPELSSNPWQITITSRDIFNVTVLQAMKQPSRPAPTCGYSTAWCIYAVILSRLWMKTGRWPNTH